MAKRRQYHVTADKKGGWKVTETGQPDVYHFETKPPAVEKGMQLARRHKPSQLLIHKKDGKIQEERTYGNDPRSSKG